jgi:hypothetical protein
MVTKVGRFRKLLFDEPHVDFLRCSFAAGSGFGVRRHRDFAYFADRCGKCLICGW